MGIKIFDIITLLVNLTGDDIWFRVRDPTAVEPDIRYGLCPVRDLPGGKTATVKLNRIVHNNEKYPWTISVYHKGIYTGIEIRPWDIITHVLIVFRYHDVHPEVFCVEAVKENQSTDFLFRHRGFGFGRKKRWGRRSKLIIARADSHIATKLRNAEAAISEHADAESADTMPVLQGEQKQKGLSWQQKKDLHAQPAEERRIRDINLGGPSFDWETFVPVSGVQNLEQTAMVVYEENYTSSAADGDETSPPLSASSRMSSSGTSDQATKLSVQDMKDPASQHLQDSTDIPLFMSDQAGVQVPVNHRTSTATPLLQSEHEIGAPIDLLSNQDAISQHPQLSPTDTPLTQSGPDIEAPDSQPHQGTLIDASSLLRHSTVLDRDHIYVQNFAEKEGNEILQKKMLTNMPDAMPNDHIKDKRMMSKNRINGDDQLPYPRPNDHWTFEDGFAYGAFFICALVIAAYFYKR